MMKKLLILMLISQSSFGQIHVETKVSVSPRHMAEYNNKLFFSGVLNPNTEGGELCWWDGKKVKSYDFWKGKRSSSPENLTVYKDKLYFSAGSPPPYGNQLCSFDGKVIKQLLLNKIGHSYIKYLTIYQDKLYFNGRKGDQYGLWSWDGNIFTYYPSPFESYSVDNLIVFSNKLYFVTYAKKPNATYSDYKKRSQLWSWDGRNFKFHTLLPADPRPFIEYNNTLCFQADTKEHGKELWIWNGTKLIEVNICPGPKDSYVDDFVKYKNKLYFTAIGENEKGNFYSWNGKKLKLEKTYNSNLGFSPSTGVVYNDILYFGAEGSKNGVEFWSFDGKKYTEVADLRPGPDISLPNSFFTYQGKLYFTATLKYGEKRSLISYQ